MCLPPKAEDVAPGVEAANAKAKAQLPYTRKNSARVGRADVISLGGGARTAAA